MRIRDVALAMVVVMASAGSAYAQKVEVAGLFGWTLSDGVQGDPVRAGDGNVYDTIDVADSASWGFDFGVNATENIQFGFLFSQQMSRLDISGSTTRELGDMKVNSYHPYVAYNAGDVDANVRPYIVVGLGATNYGSVDFTRANGQPATTVSDTQFSMSVGAGVKMYSSSNVGFRAGVQWTPTYISTEAAGWWCDPYWGCYLVGDAKYSNQFTLNGGVTFRF